MPPRPSRSNSTRPKPLRKDSAPPGLSARDLKELAGFDFVEGALDEFDEIQERGPEPPPEEKKPATAHYFSSSAPLAPGEEQGVRVQAAGADLVLLAGAGTFSKSELDEGTLLLLEVFARSPAFDAPAPRWCDLGCGWGAVACVLASQKPDATIFACDINRRAAALCAQNVRELKLPNIAAWNGDALGACRSKSFNAILCNPPVRAGNRVIQKMFEDALRCLEEDGELWIVLQTSQGAKSWQKKLAALFGTCDTMEISKGFRVLKAHRGTNDD